MLKSKIHYETKVEDEEITFICRTGCDTLKALQGAQEVVIYLTGVWTQQQEAAKKAAVEKVEPIVEQA